MAIETAEQRRARQRAEEAERDRRALAHAQEHPVTDEERADCRRIVEESGHELRTEFRADEESVMDLFDNVSEGVYTPDAKQLRKWAAQRRREAGHFSARRPDLAAMKRAQAEEYEARADALDAKAGA